MFRTHNIDKKGGSRSFNSRYEEDFDEDLQNDLEEAFKIYRRNVEKRHVEVKSNPKVRTLKNGADVSNSFAVRSNIRKNDNTGVSQINKFNFDNKNDAASLDLQKLFHYFSSKENKEGKHLENTYEKQGAIPKNKINRCFEEHESNFKTGNKTPGLKSDITKKNKKNFSAAPSSAHHKRLESSMNHVKVSQTELVNCVFTTDFYNGDEILTVNEEICNKPFFYIVPESPLPNFFFSPGSYYVTPKPPDCLLKDVVIFHPEKVVPTISELKRSTLSLEKTGTTMETELKSVQNCSKNHLGKVTFQKSDSHLNIGPSDSKVNELFKNLQTNYDPKKIYMKELLNTSGTPQNTKQRFEVSDKRNRILTETKKNDLMEENEFRDARASESFNVDGEKISDELENIVLSDTDWQSNEDMEKENKRLEIDNTMQRLMSEFPDLDSRFAGEIANRYLFDERGLQDFIHSKRLKIKKEKQLERMILALPESNYEELLEICEEFSGDEELVTNYIEEAKLAYKRRQILLEVNLVFPDADPDFLEQKIEQLLDVNSDGEVDKLFNELLDHQRYPKAKDNINAERKKLWQLYVENFDVKNYILEVPIPKNFVGKNVNEAYKELSMKFLNQRYPDINNEVLAHKLQSLNYNIIKTCDALSNFPPIKFSLNIFRNEDFNEDFLKQIVYIDHREDIEDYLKTLAELKKVEMEEALLNDSFLSCPLCCNEEIVSSDAFTCPEGHIFCKDCIKRYVSVKFSNGVYKFACPEKCDTFFSYTALQEIFPETILSNIMKKQQAEEVKIAKVDGLEYCPHCDFAYIPGAEEKIFKCQNPMCLIETCRKCGENSHIPLRCEEIERHIDVEARKKIEESMTKQLVRICPNCSKRFVKTDGCNKMACTCGTLICYICREKIVDYNHFSQNSASSGKCPLYTNNDFLHNEEVLQAGVQTKNKILQENPNINILYDPTQKK